MQTNDPDSLEQRVSRVYAQIGQDIDDAALNRRLRARLMQVSTDGTMHMKRRQPHRWFAMRPFQLARRPRTRTWSRRSPLLIAAAIVSLVVAGGAYASSSLVNQLFSLFTNHTQQSVWNDQGTNVSLSQTACGETMMIQHVYADTNRIIVGYTVRGGELAFVPHVTDAGGTLFPVLDGGDSGSGPGAGVSGHIISFDSSHIGGQPNHLALHLTAPWIAAPGSVPCPQAFDFRFTVPFIASRPHDLHQTVVSEGIAVILDRVVVSPMETKVYVHTVAKPVNMPYLADLTVNGQALESGFDGWTSGDGRDTFSFRTAPNEHGEATLILSWPNSVVMASTKQRPTSGPWTFHFTLP